MKKNAEQNNVGNGCVEDGDETPIDRDSIKNTIFDIAIDMFALSEDDKENFEEMELEYDVKCDTLDIVEFVMNLEDEFGVMIREDESDKLVTFEDCIDLIWSKVLSENNPTTEKEE